MLEHVIAWQGASRAERWADLQGRRRYHTMAGTVESGALRPGLSLVGRVERPVLTRENGELLVASRLCAGG